MVRTQAFIAVDSRGSIPGGKLGSRKLYSVAKNLKKKKKFLRKKGIRRMMLSKFRKNQRV